RTYAVAIHVLDQLAARPGDLTGEMRLLARVFVIQPKLLIFGRIKMKVGIDQHRPGLSTRRNGRDNQGCTECAEPREEAAPRRGGTTASTAIPSRFRIL